MELLCPNCQKKLTVPEQYAGQLMRCPLCQGTFTVPALPSAAPPGEGGVSFGSFGSPPAPPPQQEAYGVAQDAAPVTPPPVTPAPIRPPFDDLAAEPARRPEPPKQQAPPPPVEGYGHTVSICLSPKVLAFFAPGALFLIFIALFFTWVQTYDAKDWYTQSGWGTGFGEYNSGWGIVYILFLFPTFFLAVASAVLPFIPMKFPPQVEKFLPWRPAVVAGAILFTFLFLLVQIWPFGFGLEYVVDKPPKPAEGTKADETLAGRLQKEASQLRAKNTLERTGALRLTVLLQLAAAAAAGLELWVLLRGPSKPLPRADLSW